MGISSSYRIDDQAFGLCKVQAARVIIRFDDTFFMRLERVSRVCGSLHTDGSHAIPT